MPRTEPADVLAFANVQAAIGDMIREAARETGIATRHADRMAKAITDRIAEGSPIESAIKLVWAVQEATVEHREGGETGRTLERNKGLD